MKLHSAEDEIRNYYDALYRAWGAQHWWPADSAFEVIVGAYLTQNTAWTNVERALANLRHAGILNIEGVRKVRVARLERLIRPSGYFRQKARRLKLFISFLDKQHGGSLEHLFSQPLEKVRAELLELNGVGPETADSIILYAGNHPVVVVDAYTRRIFQRHSLIPDKSDYEEIRSLVERALAPFADTEKHPGRPIPDDIKREMRGAGHPPSPMSTAQRTALAQVYNEMHGLIVGVGKNHCRKSIAKCDGCPLQPFVPRSK